MNKFFNINILVKKIRELVYLVVNYKKSAIVYYMDKRRNKVLKLIKKIKSQSDMLLSETESYTLYSTVLNIRKVPGDIAEVGTYRGGSAKLICEAKGKKSLHVFDTFEGLPEISKKDGLIVIKKGDYKSHYSTVKKYLRPYPKVKLYKGYFPDTADPIKNKKFCMVNLDTDLYESTLGSLKFFYPRINTGGVIISHDYTHFAGVKKAIDQFFKDKPETIIEIPGSQCLIVKVS